MFSLNFVKKIRVSSWCSFDAILSKHHEIHHIPKPRCEGFLFFLEHSWLHWESLAPAHIRLRCQEVASEPQISHPLPTRSAQTSQSPSSGSGIRRGLGKVGYAAMKEPRDTRATTKNQRGGERSETNGSDGEEEEIEGGMEKDFKNNNNNGKKTNNREKNKREKRERSRRSSEAPKVLELIKMICIYLWALMSSFSIVCFCLIWIFPFHYVT